MTQIDASVAEFQSTPSVGRATGMDEIDDAKFIISIHALRGEGDKALCSTPTAASIFQSTPSVGRATIFFAMFVRSPKFQSTPSVGRATILMRVEI